MKTIVVKTKKVVSQNADMTPVYEEIEQSISPELTFNKFVKYLPNQNYVSATVISVFEQKEKTVKNAVGKDVFDSYETKELDEVVKYQSIIDEALKPKTKAGEAIDYKAESEKQSKLNAELMQRLEALEAKSTKIEKEKSQDRIDLESEAKELGIQFRYNIGDSKLKEKIEKAKS